MRIIVFLLLCLPVLGFTQHITHNHVYSSNRLVSIKDSIQVTGYIHKITAEIDGDLHIQLKLNTNNDSLLNYRNYSKQDSCLVIELICVNDSPFRKCNGYVNNIRIPALGDKVLVSGPYVYDKRHKWMEIHPVYDLKIIDSLIW